ncbi:ANTAR domain-containing response regulator [Celeribacter neptunius]|uniref:Two-component response regulator, AmiR/NasT family, consists of REC and RNA-binding antiterminator (ANTAR) domains n=1 Tax=Celeribacter neptunius TaxID=588602 RepID=A0A1I3P0P6_9RHOB|nr:ANTAR domain-containing protein [Celeribacter neptunius]SFJ15123.1 Two-component response regulator, AmiR/NasT family, consists of REC and RNA-binding antiterminator (ANTAR) domains [Celeribacter neptunius]
MTRQVQSLNLGGATAWILHRPHATVQSLSRQLGAIGLRVESAWPEPTADILAADFVFFDADMGYDEQFPWDRGHNPMPLIALIGSEAPGRIEWALSAGADAQLLKPIGDGGVYSALLIARATFGARQSLLAEVSHLNTRLNARQTVVQAVTLLVARGQSEKQAYEQLRQMAMAWRVTLEVAAERIVVSRAAGAPDICQGGGTDD